MPRFQKVYVEITNRCNLSCDFCPGTRRPGRDMTAENFALVADKLRPFTDFLYFHVMGEPLLHPDLPRLLDMAAERGFRVAITSNGTRFVEQGAVLLAYAGAPLYKISLSLHAYEANGLSAAGEALAQKAALARALGERGVITVFRLWNLPGAAEGARNDQNEAVLAALHRLFPDEWTENRLGPKIGRGVYLEWGQKFDWPDIVRAPDYGPRGYCYALKDHFGVLCDGTVVPCCLDGEGVIALGNLLTDEVQDILSGPRAQAMAAGFAGHRAVETLCRHCGYARRFLG